MLSVQQTVFLRFADADPAGVAFYPRAIALAHDLVEDLIRGSAIGWNAWFNSPDRAAPLRRAEADFFRPMKPGQQLTARAKVEKIGTTSVAFVVEFFDEEQRRAAAVRTVHVLIDTTTGQPLPLDEKMRTAFEGASS